VAIIDRDLSLAEEIVKRIDTTIGKYIIVFGDVLDRAKMETAAEQIIETFGKVDGLINAAGGKDMKHSINQYACVLLSLLLILAAPSQGRSEETAGTIVVTITGIKTSQGGTIIIALYNNGESWLTLNEAELKKTVPATDDSLTVAIENVSYGDAYAIQVIHDKNENGKFDMRKFPWPKPKEGAGVSNNKLRLGPPEYEKARFALDQPSLSLRIQLSY